MTIQTRAKNTTGQSTTFLTLDAKYLQTVHTLHQLIIRSTRSKETYHDERMQTPFALSPCQSALDILFMRWLLLFLAR